MPDMITLEPMSAVSFATWSARIWVSYREELIRSGLSESAADENVAQNVRVTMPGGIMAAGQHVFDVRDGDDIVGSVWLADRDGDWFIYDIEIDEALRGRGYGRAAMRCIEEFVRSRGGTTIGLSVFGFNDIAQKLYASEGYETTRLAMQKRLV